MSKSTIVATKPPAAEANQAKVYVTTDFLWLMSALTVTRIGSMMTPVALAFSVLGATGSPAAVAQVIGVQSGAFAVFVLAGGVASDRMSKKWIVFSSSLLGGFALLVMGFLLVSGRSGLIALTLLGIVTGAASAMSSPATQSLVSDVLPRERRQQGFAALGLIRNAAQALGPALAGLLVAFDQPAKALFLDGAMMMLGGILILGVKTKEDRKVTTTMLGQLGRGFRSFVGVPWVVVVAGGFAVLNAILSGCFTVIAPASAKRIGQNGATIWGLSLSIHALGTLVTGMLLLKVKLKRPLVQGLAGASLISLFIASVAVLGWVWLPLVCAFVSGIGIEIFNTAWGASLGTLVDDDVRGSVISYDLLLSYCATPFGIGVYGTLVGYGDSSALLVTSGIVYGVICLLMSVNPSVRSVSLATE